MFSTFKHSIKSRSLEVNNVTILLKIIYVTDLLLVIYFHFDVSYF